MSVANPPVRIVEVETAPTPLLAIDPGSERSAYVVMRGQEVEKHDILDNRELLLMLGYQATPGRAMVVEQVESYGMRVGRNVFEAVWWAGRFAQAWEFAGGVQHRLPRTAVKLHLCGRRTARDSDIRQVLLDRYGDGSRKSAVGVKAQPGPLYGVRRDVWQAIALGLTWQEREE